MEIKTRIYHPNCKVCQYEKRHKDFRYRLMRSSYFIPDGTESAAEVLAAFGMPFGSPVFYAHMKRHRINDLVRSRKKFDTHKEVKTYSDAMAGDVITTVEGEVLAGSQHELALKEIVAEGRAKLKAGDMQITLSGMINASKALADIEKGTKDRRLEAVKTMFKGITGGADESGRSEG